MNGQIHYLAALVACQLDRKLEEFRTAGLNTDQTLVMHPIERLLSEPSVLTLTWEDIKMIKQDRTQCLSSRNLWVP